MLTTKPGWQFGLQCLSGAVVLFSAGAMFSEGILGRGKLIEMSPRRRDTLATTGSFLSTASNSAGPLFAWCLRTRGLDKHALTATVAAIFLWINPLKLPQYLLAGLLSEQEVLKTPLDFACLLLLLSTVWIAVFIGQSFRHKATDRWFLGLIVLLSSVIGAIVFGTGARGLIKFLV